MLERAKLIVILLLLSISAGCAGSDEGQGEATATATGSFTQPEAIVPAQTDTPTAAAQPSATTTATPTSMASETATAAPQPTQTPTEEPVTVGYTADGNPCQRPIYPGPTAGGAGLQPVALEAVSAADETSAVITRLPHAGISFAAFAGGDVDLLVTHNNRAENGDEVILWDTAGGEQAAQFQSDQGFYEVAVSGDAPRLVALGSQGLWLLDLEQPSLASPERVAEVPYARGVAISPDGQLAAVSTAYYGEDGNWDSVLIIEAETGRALIRLEGEVVEPDVEEDDDPFAQKEMRDEEDVYLWDSQTGQLTGLLRHSDPVVYARASRDGRLIVTSVRQDQGPYPDAAWIWDARHDQITRAADVALLMVDAFERGETGAVEGMLLSFAEARSLAPEESGLLHPEEWHRLCLYGIKAGEAAAVLETCETAVGMVEDQGAGIEAQVILVRVRDSRGVARALSGDFAGAIEDFQYYLQNAVDPEAYLDDPFSFEAVRAQDRHENSLLQHQEWISELENGRNPLDQAALDEWAFYQQNP